MAEKDSKCKTKFQPPGRRRLQEVQKVASEKDSEIVKVEFVITTYPELKRWLYCYLKECMRLTIVMLRNYSS